MSLSEGLFWLGLVAVEVILYALHVRLRYRGALAVIALTGSVATSEWAKERWWRPLRRRYRRVIPPPKIWIDDVALSTISEAVGKPGLLSHQVEAEAERFRGKWRHVSGVIEDVTIWSDDTGALSCRDLERQFTRLTFNFKGAGTKDRLLHLNAGMTVHVTGQLFFMASDFFTFDECEFTNGQLTP